MIKSMTGFGKAETVFGNRKITVEIRSLNSKQLDLNLRLPAAYRDAEYEIRTRLTRSLLRGKVDAFIVVETQQTETPTHIDREVFREYLRQMTEALEFSGVEVRSEALVPCIMRLPEVVATRSESLSDEEREALLATVDRAAEALDAFRRQEGATLITDLLHRVEKIERYRQEVVPFEKARTESVRARILDSLARLQVDADRNRLEQEMIYYLEKLDITEEKVRLANHCNYFREVASSEEGAGRKLGFIAQEMGREINTMGSKANETNIQILVVKMKDELEKIKEQVLNLL